MFMKKLEYPGDTHMEYMGRTQTLHKKAQISTQELNVGLPAANH